MTTEITTHHVTMEWTKEKAIDMLVNPYMKNYLKKLTDQQLFDLGVKEGLWEKLK